jgi:hypothetical protein
LKTKFEPSEAWDSGREKIIDMEGSHPCGESWNVFQFRCRRVPMGAAAVVDIIIMNHFCRRVPMGAAAVVDIIIMNRRVPMGAAAVLDIIIMHHS